jgi:molybdopterin molybdotransferase
MERSHKSMISVEEARDLILKEIRTTGAERIGLTESLGRVLSEEIVSGVDHPPWNTSAMDGYAVRLDDTRAASKSSPARLQVVEEIPAGKLPEMEVLHGESARIMTGAPMPSGADAVVKIEETRRGEGGVELFAPGDPDFVRKKGEAIRKGMPLLSAGTPLRPAEIALLASVGRFVLPVFRRPVVSILSTGDELAEIDEPRGPEKILNSNGYGLAAQVRAAGGVPVNLGIAPDRPEELRRRLSESLFADFVLVSGGVSMGDYDFVRETLAELGAEMKFWKVAMKPGAPLAFGTIEGKPAFGLPGNPVSSMMTFEQFVRPALLKASGRRDLLRPLVRATLREKIEKAPGKRHFMRAVAILRDGRYEVRPTGNQDSHVLLSLVQANALMVLPEETETLKPGEEVWIQLLEQA